MKVKYNLTIALLCCIGVTIINGCTGNPYRDRQIVGTAGGAAVGGVLGHAIGGNTTSTVVGGAIGAGVGAAATSD